MIAQYNRHTNSTHISYNNPVGRFVWLQTSFSRLFRRWSSLRRHASTNTRLRVSECHCCLILCFKKLKRCKILMPITQVIYISNIIGHAEVIMMRRWHGEGLNNLFFLKDVSRRSLVFFLAPRARSRASRSLSRACFVRALADVLKRRKRKIKQPLCTDYSKL